MLKNSGINFSSSAGDALVASTAQHAANLKNAKREERKILHSNRLVSSLSLMLKALPENRKEELILSASREMAKSTPFAATSLSNRGFVQSLRHGKFAWGGSTPHPNFFPVLIRISEIITSAFAKHHKISLTAK